MQCVHPTCRVKRDHIYHNTVKSKAVAYQLPDDVWCDKLSNHSHDRVSYMEDDEDATIVRRIVTVDSEFIPVDVINSQSLVLDKHKLVRRPVPDPPDNGPDALSRAFGPS